MISEAQKKGMYYMLHLMMKDLYNNGQIRGEEDEFTPLAKSLMRAVQELEEE